MGNASVDHAPGHAARIAPSSLLTSRRGIWAVKWSLICLLLTALLQGIIVYYSGSVALRIQKDG